MTLEEAVNLYHDKSLIAEVKNYKRIDNCHILDDMAVVCIAENNDDVNKLYTIELTNNLYERIYMFNAPLFFRIRNL